MKKNFYLIIVLTLSVLFGQANTQSVLWSENFEGDWTANWHADAGTWEAGVPTSGPNAAYAGENCAATILDGNYTEPVSSRLIRHKSFTVPSATQNPRLRFWHWYSFSHADYGKVQIKVDGTNNWVDVSTSYTNTGSNLWTYPSIDLSDYSGQSVQIAFYFYSTDNFMTSGSDVSTGWYIDDIEVITGPVVFNDPEGWENGIGDWASERGTWEVGTPTSGPGSAHNGSKCAATVLLGNYVEPVESRLISPTYLVPSASENPRLRFWHWYSFSHADYGKVQIKVDGTNNWVDVPSGYFTNTSSNLWTYAYFSLIEYAGQSIQIAFYFYSTDNFMTSGPDVSFGWYVDDIVIEYDSQLSTENDIQSFNFEMPPQTGTSSIDATNKTVDIEVEYGTDLTSLVAEFTLSDGATAKVGDVVQEGGVTSNDFSSPVTYSVTAEDGTTIQDWVVTVSVAPNTETEILDFGFGIPPQTGTSSIDATNKTIDIEVDYGTDLTSLVAEFILSDGATAKVGDVVQESGVTANDFTTPVTYTVTAEDGTTIQDWVVTVLVAPNTETEILTYSFGIPPQTGAASIDEVNCTVDIEVESGTDLTALVATFTLSGGATAEVGGVAQTSGTTSNNFSSPVTYTITAEDGTTTQDWVITVTEEVVLSNETDILTYSFGMPPQTGAASIKAVNHTVNVEVESGTDLTALIATFTLSGGATAEVGGVVQTSGTTSNNFSSPVTYRITAEDGTTEQDWVITVTVAAALRNATDILSFSFGMPPQTGAASINAVNHTVDIEVESGTDLTALVATFTLSGGATAEVGGVAQTSGTTSNNFSSPVTYTITAEDGTTQQDWVITVTVATTLSNATDILSFSFGMPPQTGAATINHATRKIAVEVEYGTNLTDLVTVFTLSAGASAKISGVAQVSGNTANDFTLPVTYTITAEDGITVRDWLVTVSVAPSTENEILEFGFGIPPQTGAATIDATNKTIDIELEYGTDLTSLVAEFTLSDGATAKAGDVVQESGVTANDFTSPVTYTVTAEDGVTVQDWIVTVAMTPNTEAEILEFGFGIPPQTKEAVINPDTRTIKIEAESETDLTNLVATFLLSEGATAKIGETEQVSGITQNDFSSLVTYTITAEDETTVHEWSVLVNRITGADEISLRNLKIYPNPFSESTTIEFSNPKHSNHQLILYNILGEKILEMSNITSERIILSRGTLKSGIYLVELRGEQTFNVRSIVVR